MFFDSGCSLWFKDTNLKANHNYGIVLMKSCLAVLYGSKILIWKQITTSHVKLQTSCRCSLWFKDTNLKANHNTVFMSFFFKIAVLYGSKILIWKQITTPFQVSFRNFCCSLWFKDTNLKANHNRRSQQVSRDMLFFMVQRY